jgi:hypothetical protein
MALTIDEKNRLNNDFHPTAQGVGLGDAVFSSPIVITYDANSDHTVAQQAFVAPFAMRIVDISVKANAANASGTLVPRKGTDAMCTGIVCAVDGAVSRIVAGATAANDARLTLAKGDVVNVISTGGTVAATRGFVTFTGVRL